MMKEALLSSSYFGLILSIFLFLLAVRLKAKFRVAILNPLLVSTIMVIAVLMVFQIPYEDYKASANLLRLLKDNLVAVLAAITAGTLCSILSILLMGKLLGLTAEHIATLLPKSITTAIGMGVSEEAGGIVTLTVAAIIITGILGNMIAELVFHLFHIDHPIARGLALGTSAHAVGTAKALELGEIEGAMGSISICVAGILTVVLVPLVMNVA